MKVNDVLLCNLVVFDDGNQYYRFASDMWYRPGADMRIPPAEALELEKAYQEAREGSLCLTLPVL